MDNNNVIQELKEQKYENDNVSIDKYEFGLQSQKQLPLPNIPYIPQTLTFGKTLNAINPMNPFKTTLTNTALIDGHILQNKQINKQLSDDSDQLSEFQYITLKTHSTNNTGSSTSNNSVDKLL